MSNFSERESEVLSLVAEAKCNKEIARTLGVTERTVEFHITNIFKKLGLGSRMEAALWLKEQERREKQE
ncbi:MAG: response regulator transcription factor [Chloroflexi bacterium]|nr:response regulator transcription factor [Chloroflexota bacterium]